MEENWPTIITAIVALYGAVLSTYTVISKRRSEARRIQVKMSNGFLTFGPKLSELMLFVEATNPGNRTVTLNLPGIALPGDRSAVLPAQNSDVTFPHPLGEGQSCRVWIPAHDLAVSLREAGLDGKVKLRGFVRDQVGSMYRSSPWRFDIRKLINVDEQPN